MKRHDGYWWPDADKFSHVSQMVRDLGALDMALSHVREWAACIQAGGAVGVWPLRLAPKFERVITFEADPAQYECLLANLGETQNVLPRPMALADQSGRVGILHNDDRALASRVGPGADIEAVTVDSFAPQSVGLICLDIEGMELPALRGATETIDRCRPVVLCEEKNIGRHYGVSPGEIGSWLSARGYKCVGEYKYDRIYAS